MIFKLSSNRICPMLHGVSHVELWYFTWMAWYGRNMIPLCFFAYLGYINGWVYTSFVIKWRKQLQLHLWHSGYILSVKKYIVTYVTQVETSSFIQTRDVKCGSRIQSLHSVDTSVRITRGRHLPSAFVWPRQAPIGVHLITIPLMMTSNI